MGMADAREAGVAARRIDDDEVAILELGERIAEASAVLLCGGDRGIEPARLNGNMARDRQRQLRRARPAVLDIAGQRPLPGIEIDASDGRPRRS